MSLKIDSKFILSLNLHMSKYFNQATRMVLIYKFKKKFSSFISFYSFEE